MLPVILHYVLRYIAFLLLSELRLRQKLPCVAGRGRRRRRRKPLPCLAKIYEILRSMRIFYAGYHEEKLFFLQDMVIWD